MSKNGRLPANALAEHHAPPPFDVLHSILVLLPQNDLRIAAAVSRKFRETAKEAGLYIHRTITWSPETYIIPEVDILVAVIKHAKKHDCRISLDVSYTGPVPWNWTERDSLRAETRAKFELLAECISLATANLVFLRVTVPEYHQPLLDAALLRPAPHLRALEIRGLGGRGALRDVTLTPLPPDLFARAAPKLQSVSLACAALGKALIPAFSCVENLRMNYEEIFPDADVALSFPRLRNLDIAYRNEGRPAEPAICILRGLDLSKLIVDVQEHDNSILAVLADELDLSSIPDIKCYSSAGLYQTIWAAPLCADADTELSAHLTQHDALESTAVIDVTARGADWRCVYTISRWGIQEPHPVFGEDADLSSLRLDNTSLPGLLESNISLPRLRELRIDLRPHGEHATMIWPAAWGVTLSPDDGGDPRRGYSVPCPALETLAIVALERPMRVRETEVVQLSEALGQHCRKDGARAQLVLRDVSFVSVGLDQMFSTVRSEVFLRNY